VTRVTASPTVLVVQNSPTSGPGLLPEWIEAAGATVRLIAAYDGVAVPTEPGGCGAVVLLGGGLMPDADLDHPWLPAERELVRSCRAFGVPVLGICLGGQLIAHTFGGDVRARQLDRAEAGVVQIDLRPEAADDPLLGGLDGPLPAVEHHEDAIVGLPPEAVWLASTPVCPLQAFRLDTLWAVQFHPEAPASRVAQWDRVELVGQGYDPDALVAEAERHAEAMNQLWPQVISRFVALAEA
jgi:GMP synthase (glutamine-hydrolysing)